ncbi:MAG: branched-chain amino acid transaminase [Vicinamibacterales bacterium]
MSSPCLPRAYFDGRFVPGAEARLPIGCHAVQYGQGVFAGIRGYLDQDGSTINVFRLPDHFRRFVQSASLIKVTLPGPVDALVEIATELTRRNAPAGDVYYRPFAYDDGEGLGPSLGGRGFAIYMLPVGDLLAQTGLHVMVSSWRRVTDNAIPARGKISGAYVNSALVREDARVSGFDDAIVLNERGKVAEASVANPMLVRGGTLITPVITGDILEGITRRSLLQLARDMALPVEEREVDRTELYLADEIFLCGTGAQLAPVVSVDRRPVGAGQPGPIATMLRRRFMDIVCGREPHYAAWLTPVAVTASVQA